MSSKSHRNRQTVSNKFRSWYIATALDYAWGEKLQVLYEDLQVLYENLQVLYGI